MSKKRLETEEIEKAIQKWGEASNALAHVPREDLILLYTEILERRAEVAAQQVANEDLLDGLRDRNEQIADLRAILRAADEVAQEYASASFSLGARIADLKVLLHRFAAKGYRDDQG